MLKKKVCPIIDRTEEIEKKKIVGLSVEYRLFGLLIYKKTIYTPARYDVHRVEGIVNENLVLILLNK